MEEAAGKARDDAGCVCILPKHLRRREVFDAWDAPTPPKPVEPARVPSEKDLRDDAFEVAYRRYDGSVEMAMKEVGIQKTAAYKIVERRRLKG